MYRQFQPKHLNKLVRAIWCSDSDVDPADGYIVAPSLGCQLVIKIYPSEIEIVLSGPVTQQKKYLYIVGAHYFGVEFAPYVGTVFADVLLKDLKNGSIPVNHILGIDLRSLANQLQSMNQWREQSALIQTAISRRYPENGQFLNPNILLAINVAHEFYGNVSIKEVAETVGVSKRHLERLFLRHTGVSPKTFCTTLRLQRVLRLLGCRPSPSLANVAIICGYTDQAHLANEFKRLMGTSILTYLDSAK